MRDFLHRYVLHNLGLKLISLALAVGVWLAVARDPVAEVAVDVAIEFHNVPQNLEISSETIPRAQIRLRGPERVIHGLRPSDVYAEIELSGLKPGERTFDLTAKQIHEPAELEVVQVIPSQFHLAFDTRLTREVPVQPRVVGTFARGYGIERIVVDPANITISGPKKHVEAVEAAITDPVDVSGAIDRLTFSRHAYVPDPLIQVASPDPVQSNGHYAESYCHRRPSNPQSTMTSQTRQLFGTDGIRGVAGEFPLTLESTYLIGRALGHDLIRSDPHASVVIGQDTRESSSWIADRVLLGLVSSGCEVHSAGVITTPGVAYLARSRKHTAGVVISASHNPWTDNGIKVFSGDGYKLPDSHELAIEQEIFALLQNPERHSPSPVKPAPSLPGEASLRHAYVEWLATRSEDGSEQNKSFGGLRERRGHG